MSIPINTSENTIPKAVDGGLIPVDAEPTPPKAPSVLLIGEMGSGKTTAIRSLIDLGIEVFYLALEPGFEELLGDIPQAKLKWCYLPAFGGKIDLKEGHTFDTLLDQAKLINSTSHDSIQKMGGIKKENHTQIYDVIKALNNFVDDRTGESFGDVAHWDHKRCLFLDGLSALSQMAIRNTVGDKPFLELRDYSAVQFLIRQIVNGLCYRTNAWFVMSAHLERETDPNTGAYKLMVSVPGKALSPEIPRFFSDSIYCRMRDEGGKAVFTWNTLSNEVTVKSRNLPLKAGLDPNFKLLMQTWRKRVGLDK